MKSAIGAAFVVVALAFTGPAGIDPAAAAPQAKARNSRTSDVIDFSAPRNARRSYHHAYHRPHDRPHYYDRPVYYRPYPYGVPAPFTLGIAFDPPWW